MNGVLSPNSRTGSSIILTALNTSIPFFTTWKLDFKTVLHEGLAKNSCLFFIEMDAKKIGCFSLETRGRNSFEWRRMTDHFHVGKIESISKIKKPRLLLQFIWQPTRIEILVSTVCGCENGSWLPSQGRRTVNQTSFSWQNYLLLSFHEQTNQSKPLLASTSVTCATF